MSHRALSSLALVLCLVLAGSVCAGADLKEFADGTRDATDALQEAFDQGGTVLIPAGVFRFSRPLHITQSNTSVIGTDGSVLLLAPGDVNDGILVGPPPDKRDDIGSVRDVRLVNVTVRNSPENYDWGRNKGTGIEVWGVYDARIENCRVENFVHDAIAVRVCRNVLVSGCDTRGGRHGISLWGHYDGGKWGNRDIRITACHVQDAWDTGIAVGFFTSDVTITGCIVRDARCHGIDIFNVSSIVVSGNVVRDWLSGAFAGKGERVDQAVGIFIHTDWGVPRASEIPTEDIVVTGNSIVHGPYAEGQHPVCVEITGTVSGVTVAGNTVSGGQMALAMNGTKADGAGEAACVPRNIVVSDNVFREQANLFWIGGGAPEVHGLVSNNVFSPKPDAGAHLDINLKGLVISDNVFHGGRLPEKTPAGVVWRDNVTEQGTP